MPIISKFTLPVSAEALPISSSALFLAFVTANDPATNQSWCPDVRAALPHIKAAFEAQDSPEAALVEVGQLAEWRDKSNVFRTKWNVNNVPTMLRFENVDGGMKETGRLVEAEILDAKRLADFIAKK